MKLKKLLTTTALTGFLVAGSAQASVLAIFELEGGSAVASDQNGGDGITVSDLNFNSLPAAVSSSSQNFIQVDGSQDVGGSNNAITNLGQAVAASSFFSFVVTNNSGLELQLDSFSVDTTYVNTFNAGYGLFSSADGFDAVSDDLIDNRVAGQGILNFNEATTTQVTDLLTLDGAGANVASTDFLIADGASLTFFLVGTQNSSSATRISEFDNISISGTTIPVPEPSSAALLGLGGLALILRRRK